VLGDDLGLPVEVPSTLRRVVSLVPSLTESVAATCPDVLVGATRWCTHPAVLDVARIGGTKNPDLARIVELRPDLVLANEEENREADLAALRDAGLAVWVTVVRSLPEAFASLTRMLAVACHSAKPAWLTDAAAAWRDVPAVTAHEAAVPIWRRPWMVLGRDTFAGDVLARLGVRNRYADHPERYPRVALSDIAAAPLVVLPDEPYPFGPADGPECFPNSRVALVSGRHLTWYGPSLVAAPAVLARQLAGEMF
jgi:ABC-type Fe3+-hydroxamate transport system substrate-binding protein